MRLQKETEKYQQLMGEEDQDQELEVGSVAPNTLHPPSSAMTLGTGAVGATATNRTFASGTLHSGMHKPPGTAAHGAGAATFLSNRRSSCQSQHMKSIDKSLAKLDNIYNMNWSKRD